ncbi:MAG: IS4 family transposase [Tannerellaceae bacterium]|nr:IS4 family transposase [Tannerellaceae bacterium]
MKKSGHLYNHKISLGEILGYIPDEELCLLSDQTHVDYCSKVLSGKLMFYLLIYGLLRVPRLSQRGLSEAFGSPFFRSIFHYKGKGTISHSAISQRLGVINVDFFERAYSSIYTYFSSLYTKKEVANLYLERVDSTLVRDVSNRLKEGLSSGNAAAKRKLLKFTINFDGMFGSLARVHKENTYLSESVALPENILSHIKKHPDHARVYIIDRGQSSAEAFKEMKNQKGLLFVGRLQDNRKLKVIEESSVQGVCFESGRLLFDQDVKLYKKVKEVGKNGKEVNRQQVVEELFRVIRFLPQGAEKPITLITNCFDMSANEIALIYKRRWDIEVFFRFLKQELNFSHFLSLNENGIQVVLYMTLITAMLVMIYKRENLLGYRSAIRRMGIELEHLVLAIMVIQSGGDLKKTDLHYP